MRTMAAAHSSNTSLSSSSPMMTSAGPLFQLPAPVATPLPPPLATPLPEPEPEPEPAPAPLLLLGLERLLRVLMPHLEAAGIAENKTYARARAKPKTKQNTNSVKC